MSSGDFLCLQINSVWVSQCDFYVPVSLSGVWVSQCDFYVPVSLSGVWVSQCDVCVPVSLSNVLVSHNALLYLQTGRVLGGVVDVG